VTPEEAAKPEQAAPEQAEPGTQAEPGAVAGTAAGCSEEFLFDANETALDAENERTLKSLANCLKSDPSITAVVIEGRADPRGSAEYNEGLARGRAQSVSDALTALGVPSEEVTIGIGEPLCSETTQECLQKNRSVTATAKR
jgi:peptidoglycan-associated lipoprotein